MEDGGNFYSGITVLFRCLTFTNHQRFYGIMNQVKLDTHSDHLRDLMQGLMMNGDFSDVTLVTEDKNIFKAHKNILTACSPFFKDLMTFDQKSSSIIYLRGVHFSELKLIMQFIYLGEATIHKEGMSEFINVARSLEIKELIPRNPEDEISVGENDDESELNIYEEHVTESNKECPEDVTPTENQDISQDNLEKGEKKIVQLHQELESTFSCEQCDNKYSRSSHLRRHVKSKHEDCFKYACVNQDISQGNLEKGEKNIVPLHQELESTFSCEKCGNKYSRSSHLRRHIKSKHDYFKYACDHCDFQTTIQYHLKKHIEESHEEVKYICDLCDYKATRKSNLRRHFERRHE